METFRNCYQNQDHLAEIQADYQQGLSIGIQGTPSFYINGQFYSGARPYSFFEGIILRELDELGIPID